MEATHRLFLASLLLAAMGCPCTGDADANSGWRSCEEGLIAITDVRVPDRVSAGNPATFTLHAETDAEVPGGRLDVAVKYQGVHVYSKTGSLCDAVSCPVPSGASVLTMVEQMPHFAPPGAYTMRLEASTTDAAALFCVEVDFRIGFGRNPVGMVASLFGQ